MPQSYGLYAELIESFKGYRIFLPKKRRGRIEELKRIESGRSLEISADSLIHGNILGRIQGSVVCVIIELGNVHAIPSELLQDISHVSKGGAPAFRIGEVHE